MKSVKTMIMGNFNVKPKSACFVTLNFNNGAKIYSYWSLDKKDFVSIGDIRVTHCPGVYNCARTLLTLSQLAIDIPDQKNLLILQC